MFVCVCVVKLVQNPHLRRLIGDYLSNASFMAVGSVSSSKFIDLATLLSFARVLYRHLFKLTMLRLIFIIFLIIR